MRNVAMVAGWVLLGAMCAMPVCGAEPVITDIDVRNVGPGPIDESYIQAYTTVKVGAALNRPAVARDVRALLDTGRFSEVDVELEPDGDGLRLIYLIRNRPRLASPIEVVGAEHIRPRAVRDLLDLHIGDFVDDQVLGVRARKVREEYGKRLFPDADITWVIEDVAGREALANVTMHVDEKRKATVHRILVRGNSRVKAKELKALIPKPGWWNPLWWFRTPPYDVEKYDMGRQGMLRLYRDRGFLDVKIKPPVVVRDEADRVFVQYSVEEGPQYRFGGVTLDGSGLAVFPESELRRMVNMPRGDIASASLIDGTRQALRDYFGSRGYAYTSVRPQLLPDRKKGIVDARFVITEGDLVKLRNVLVRGNTRTRDKVIRREFLVYPGEILNEVKVKQSERIVSNLGFFSSVRSELVDTRVPDEKDLIFNVEEKRTGQFIVGGGFSSIDKVIGFMELSQGNFDLKGWPYFTGGGQKLKVRAQFGSTRSDYDLSFVEPWFLDRKLSLGLDLYRSELDYDDYDVRRTGFAVSLGQPLPGPNRVDVRYRIERTTIRDVADTNRYVYLDSPNEDYFFQAEEDTLESSIRVSLTHDTRNNAFVPTAGNRAVLFGEVTTELLGADLNVYGLGLNAVHYQPLWLDHVLSLRTRVEVIEEFGNTKDIPIDDRLFVGGGRTIRGYDYRDVGPKVVRADAPADNTDYRRVGGRTMAMATAEYTIPLFSHVRFAGFFDIGNVWRDAFDFDLGTLASGAGVGLRLDMPGFPIRIDRAWTVKKDHPITDEDTWVFWIGYDY